MSNVSQWETSAPNNDAAPPDGAPEGMAANTVNDTMREMMAATARWYQDINGSLVTGGAGNAYTLTTNNNNSSLTDLPLVVFVANRANSGAATLNVDGLGAKSLRFGGVALAAGVLQEDVAYIAIYNAEDDAFDIVGYPTRDASQITTGTLPDARLSSNVPLKNASNAFTASGAGPNNTAIRIVANAPYIDWTETDQAEDARRWLMGGLNGFLGFGPVADSATQLTTSQLALLIGRTGAALASIAIGNTIANPTITLNGVNVTDFARKSQPNTFEAAQTISAATPFWRLEETDQGTDGKNWLGVSSGGSLSIGPYTDALAAGTGGLTMARSGATVTGAVLAATAIQLDGATRAATIANSTSTTLTPGQIHHVTGNCTVPTLTAGQWVAIVNHSSSPITLTRRSGTALYWTLTGENSATVTIGPRGRVVVSCAASGSDYVSGDIVGST